MRHRFSALLLLALAAPLSAQAPTRAELDSLRAEFVRMRAWNRSAETTGTRIIAYLEALIARYGQTPPPVVVVPPDTVTPPTLPPDNTTPPLPPPAGVLAFYSDFSTCLGVTFVCKSDGSRWSIALSQDQHNVGAVVLGSEAGFPSAHALRITPNSNQSGLRLTNATLGPLPENSSRYYRYYFRLDHRRIGDSNNHPIETSTLLSGTIAWAFRSNALTDSTWTAQMRITGTVVYESPILRTHVPYRVEFQLERLAGVSFRLHMRVFDMAGTLVAGNDRWRLANGSGTLADLPVLQFDGLAGLPGIQIGLNGLSNTDWHPSILYGYQGAFCVRSDTWCGPYVAGEGR
jgi:hypothetical protein